MNGNAVCRTGFEIPNWLDGVNLFSKVIDLVTRTRLELIVVDGASNEHILNNFVYGAHIGVHVISGKAEIFNLGTDNLGSTGYGIKADSDAVNVNNYMRYNGSSSYGPVNISNLMCFSGEGVGVPDPADNTKLITAMSTASALLENTAVGDKAGNVPQAAADALQSVIAEAYALNYSDSAAQADMDSKVSVLTAATNSFRSSIIAVTETPNPTPTPIPTTSPTPTPSSTTTSTPIPTPNSQGPQPTSTANLPKTGSSIDLGLLITVGGVFIIFGIAIFIAGKRRKTNAKMK
jgi:LPXTG-motif cell wall-anchored protein